MPIILIYSLKTSLLSRLFVFTAPLGFTIYFHLFCFTTCNSSTISNYSLLKSQFPDKQSFYYFKLKNSGSKTAHTRKRYMQYFSTQQNHSKSNLQNAQQSKKHLKNTLKELKSKPNIQKSTHKQSQAIKKHSSSLLFRAFLWLFLLCSSQNSMAHGVS